MESIPRTLTLVSIALLSACATNEPRTYQGYVEGEFVHVASGVGGRLERLVVQRGQTVEAGAALFDLESTGESADVRQAEEGLSAVGAQLADLETGRRGPEIEVIRAQLAQAQAMEKQSAARLERDAAQLEAGGVSRMQLEESQAKHEVDVARLHELEGQLEVARLSARPDQIKAQNSEVAAAQAALDRAKWRLDEKHITAPEAALVVDTLFREGEWVSAGSPVVRMLPPNRVKVRFFVPEADLRLFPVGHDLTIQCDGCEKAIAATVTYVSTEPEYTPPVIYSDDLRSKLVFMIEARPSPQDAAALRPGQPVGVRAP